jgi:hypothetical protein
MLINARQRLCSVRIACDRLGHKIVSLFLAAGAWLSGAFAVLVWLWPGYVRALTAMETDRAATAARQE